MSLKLISAKFPDLRYSRKRTISRKERSWEKVERASTTRVREQNPCGKRFAHILPIPSVVPDKLVPI
jgi:hypothetical protein